MMTRKEAKAICRGGRKTVVRVLLNMDARIHSLEQSVKLLEDRLAKNSRNSGKPPSTDGYQKPSPKSLREKSGRRSGGQPGHDGHTLARAEKPDFVERHKVDVCGACGRSLSALSAYGVESRQVHDLPPVRPVVTEHRAETKVCVCGHRNKAAFPQGVNAPVQYGSGVKAVAVYLNNFQMLPFERTCGLFADLFGFTVSQGTLANFTRECHKRLADFSERTKALVAQAPVAHFDESGVRVINGLRWLHSASTASATHYEIHRKRGSEGIDSAGILPGFRGRAIHDFWRPYFLYDCSHGLCNAHHLRELTFVREQNGQAWAGDMIKLLREIKKAADKARPAASALPKAVVRDFEARFQRVIDNGHAANPLPEPPPRAIKKRGRRKKTKPRNLLERLDVHRRETLAFMYDFNVPFDNNLAERDIRMMKVQQKISGTFRSEAGAGAFCRIRSYVSTARKNALGAMDALVRAVAGNPFVPTANTT